jgi:two-component system chemotaxis response regulator CheB
MTRILIVDGEASRRKHLRGILAGDPSLTVVGEVTDAAGAKDAALQLKPDLILIADRLPGGKGLDVTAEIMTEAPTPIIVMSEEHDPGNVAAAMNALRMGALTILSMPTEAESRRFTSTVKAMALVRVVRRWREHTPRPYRAPPASAGSRPPLQPSTRASGLRPPSVPIRAVAVGASTGGPAALQRLLSDLSGEFHPSILIVQHISKGFLGGLVQWLASKCPLTIKVAEQGELIRPATVYIAPDDRHLGLDGGARILLDDSPPIGGFRPSATFLFDTVAKALGPASVHIIMTGMGHDGVAGLGTARARGATVLAQDEASSIVFGMPAAAIKAGVVDRVVALDEMAQELERLTAQS